ncbi:MAG: nucleotidyltransferase domain-containing protein [Pseudomonadota bacterium]|nr:nucleotidyltransferase domain-containing protein [Pseudomonadota bacterium]
MRLSSQARHVIRDTVREIFGPEATVALFGSRLDDEARGGDIDLLVQSTAPIRERQRKVLTLVARLQMRLGDQPIDVLVLDPETNLQPIHKNALRMGQTL